MLKKIFQEGHSLLWTVSGTAMVLITLSGEVLRYALWISSISLVAHLIGFLVLGGSDEE
jgi:hypothetical protein